MLQTFCGQCHNKLSVAYCATTLSTMTLSIITLSVMTLSVTKNVTLDIMTFSIMIQDTVMLNVTYAERPK
jgi:hypothetical protein